MRSVSACKTADLHSILATHECTYTNKAATYTTASYSVSSAWPTAGYLCISEEDIKLISSGLSLPPTCCEIEML